MTDAVGHAKSDGDPPVDLQPAEAQARTPVTRGRRIFVNSLIAFTTVLAVVGMLSVFANRLLFNPDNWANTSTQLLQNSDIRSATSNYVVDQLYANVNVGNVLKSALPKRLQPLAGPAAGALQNAAVQAVDLALARPKVQTLWANANRAAAQAFVAVVNGGTKNVKVNHGVVSLDLASIIGQIASRLGLPASITSKLPSSIAHLTVLKSNQLKLVQNVGNAIQGLALWLTIIVPVLYGAAIVLARGRRRRTLMAVGFAIVLSGIIGIALRHLLVSGVTNSLVKDASLKPAVHATLEIMTSILGTVAGAFILVGAVAAAAAWFAGPARIATTSRRAITPFLRERPQPTFSIAAALMVLVFIWDPIPATGTPAGIIVFFALAMLGTEALRRQTEVEFPDARMGDATAAIRARWASIRGRRRRIASADGEALTTTGLVDDLARLSTLQREGAISGEEYEAAKARLLQV